MPNRKSMAVACCAGICCCTAAVADPSPAPPHVGIDVEIAGRLVHEFAWSRDAGGPFDRHCFAPCTAARLSDRATVAVEVEFAQDGLAGGRGDGEVVLTFAVMEYRFRDEFQFRGGIVPSPLGGINLHHGSPLDNLTELPLVDGSLLRSSQRESGLGVSTHSGQCREGSVARRTVAALDVRADLGGLGLQGALASASAAAGANEHRHGAYAQIDWRARRDLLMRGSSLDLIARVDAAGLDEGGERASALTLGLNFLPSADAVFRLDHTWSRAAADGGEAEAAPGRTRFSVATCF